MSMEDISYSAPGPAPLPSGGNFAGWTLTNGEDPLVKLGILPAVYATPTGEKKIVQIGPDGKTVVAPYFGFEGSTSAPAGTPIDYYKEDGSFSHTGQTKKIGSLGSDLVKFAALAGGLAVGVPALMGTAGAGAGAAAAAAAPWEAGFVGTEALSGAAGLGGAAAAGAGGLAAAGGGGGVSGLLSNPLIKGAVGGLAGLAGGGGGGGSALEGLGGILSGAYDYHQQNKAADNMLEWLKGQQAKIDSIYDPQGERAKFMWDEMSRKDAAAGRNSQYGPRTTDFLGKFGGEYAGHTANLSRGLAGNFSDSFNQKATAGSGLSAGIGNFLGGAGKSIVQNMSSVLGNDSSSTPQGFDLPESTFDIADWWS